jgi:hypothetical protein
MEMMMKRLTIVWSEQAWVEKVAAAKARYKRLLHYAETIRRDMWLGKPFDPVEVERAMWKADEALQALVDLEDDLMLLRSPGFAWKSERLVVVNMAVLWRAFTGVFDPEARLKARPY